MCCHRCYRHLPVNATFDFCQPCLRLEDAQFKDQYDRVCTIVVNMRRGQIKTKRDRWRALDFVCKWLEDLYTVSPQHPPASGAD